MSQHKYISIDGVDRCEHVILVERVLGRRLPQGAEVHHVDGNPRNNANSNLVVCQDKAYHKLLHVRLRIRLAGGDPDRDRICSRCKQILPLAAFAKRHANLSYGLQSACRSCMDAYRRDRKARTEAA